MSIVYNPYYRPAGTVISFTADRAAGGGQWVRDQFGNMVYVWNGAMEGIAPVGAYQDWSRLTSKITAFGGAGDDVLVGGSGSDYFTAGAGNDWLSGNAGNDTIYGEDGNDYILFRNDWNYAGATGNDYLDGGTGNDTLFGGGGNDKFIFAASGNGRDLIADFHQGDQIKIMSQANSAFDGTSASLELNSANLLGPVGGAYLSDAADVGGNTVLTLWSKEQIVVAGVTTTQLSQWGVI